MQEAIDYEKLVDEIHGRLRQFKDEGKRAFATSSLQTQSIPLLYILSTSGVDIPVYFINTGYHFPKTIQFRDKVTRRFGLQMLDLRPLVSKDMQRDMHGNLYFTSDPDYCCYLNKIQPLDSVLASHDVWINGIRADQNTNRRGMKKWQKAPKNTLRYHPMLEWSGKMIYEYINLHHLPHHPMDEEGYASIGCEPCTSKLMGDNVRDARWAGLNKTECGLHTDLAKSDL